MTTIKIKAQTEDNSQIEAIKTFMKALKIRFELTNEPNYNPEFVAKIEQGDRDKPKIKAGKLLWLNWTNCGSNPASTSQRRFGILEKIRK